MKRPSFQFYPADWKNNSKLRRCSEAARGAWVDVLCLLHDSDEYGVCRWPMDELARAAGVPVKLVKELATKDVLKGADKNTKPYIHTPRHAGKNGEPVLLVSPQDGPCWYSSRLVRDEWVRARRGAGTRFDEENQPQRTKAPTTNKNSVGTERARLRASVLEKTGGYCYHCKCHLSDIWEIDHFIPRAKGGSNFFSNLVPSCVSCNQDKSDTMPDDWKQPTGSPTRRVGERQGDGPTSTSTSSITTSVPIGTDAIASAGIAHADALFQIAVPWLVERGMPDKNARSLLGGARKQLGDEGAWALASECIKESPMEPAAWLAAALNARIKGSKNSRHSGFENTDYSEGVTVDGRIA